ncbi:SH3 domain-containing protein [Novosphingobium piscinae]|uniref:SH3 domain-containing protein n=1 Tax=Novosphingobium piscinae TaxID=1507448 RepID=A0A7X1KP23_9SPHN|nr:SH3 domain-containing protein [Novosphingobium piscinae]MBC2668291.1 SH3 domain-containing protein [Novosphingobium piscinae]
MTDIAAITTPGVSFGLAGPSEKLDPAHLPVRGDLAHIRLAGKVFVPHYVVPMPHRVNGAGTQVFSAARTDAEVLADLPTGTPFQVLDLAGSWAWGQVGTDEGGVVGYVPAAALHAEP